jgi:hypothetical protein
MDMATNRRSGLKTRDDHSGEVRRGTVDQLVYSNAPLQMKRGLTPIRLVLRNELTDGFAVSLNHALKQFRILAGLLRGELADLHGCVKHLTEP